MLTEEEVEKLNAKCPKLAKQTYDQIASLTTLAPQVISRQATLNIGSIAPGFIVNKENMPLHFLFECSAHFSLKSTGTIGHVAHGKSTVVKAITGINPLRHRDEKVRNITIKLGYANAKLYKCPKCQPPQCYKSFSSSKEDSAKCTNPGCDATMDLLRHISFVDCPGHDLLMSTMLTGTAVMDTAFLLIAGDKPCPQPQTSEHLAAVEIMQLKKMIILQNKIDIVFKEGEGAAKKNYEEIKAFIAGTTADHSPIIPLSAQLQYNIDAVLHYICDYIPIPKRRFDAKPHMMIIRSFDVNKPGTEVENLKGGVVGGSIISGVLKVGDEIEIRPGNLQKDAQGNITSCVPIYSRILSLFAEENDLLYAIPGGLIAAGLTIDPNLTKADGLVGSVRPFWLRFD